MSKFGRTLFWLASLLVGLAYIAITLGWGWAAFQHMLLHGPHATIFWTHILASATAITVMPFQFWQGLRNRRRALHRWIGRGYVMAVGLGGLSGLYMAFFTLTGTVSGVAFFVLGVFWLVTTGMAVARARAGQIAAHRRWMIRSAALTMAAVTLRLYIPISQVAGLPFDTSYTVISWACWVPNLLIAEWWLNRRPRASAAVPGRA